MGIKLMLLGSGELGKEFAISAKRLGCEVVAVDNYSNAPAMQVTDLSEVIDMLDGEALEAIVTKHKPDFIVPEIEAIRTEKLYEFEQRGITVVPSAKATNYTMNRKAIRDLAAIEVGVQTATYKYATNPQELKAAAIDCGFPCVVKPLMSSSGKGQSVLRSKEDAETAWNFAVAGSRGDVKEVIVESFIDFEYEITLLTVTQSDGNTLFCPPIGHRQERGDYQESWQPASMNPDLLSEAQVMAKKVTEALGGNGIWGVEFFIGKHEVWFSELSPRPHDTGMVTLAQTQNLNEFELHLRAILGIPISDITLNRSGASAVILASNDGFPTYCGLNKAATIPHSDFRIFGKPSTRPYRRMGVGLAWGNPSADINEIRQRAQQVAEHIHVNHQKTK